MRRPRDYEMRVIEGSGRGKWAVREGWAGSEWGFEGLGRAWKIREVLSGKYRSFHAPDETVFFDHAEALYYRSDGGVRGMRGWDFPAAARRQRPTGLPARMDVEGG